VDRQGKRAHGDEAHTSRSRGLPATRIAWGLTKLIPKITFGGCASNRFVMSNDFTNDKGQELLGKVWVEFADRREMPQTADLLGFPPGIAESSPCRAFNLPTAWVHRNRSANMWTIAASMLSMLSRRSRSLETGSAVSTITPSLSRSASATEFGLPEERRREPVTCLSVRRRALQRPLKP
jgi:hypothetical protein